MNHELIITRPDKGRATVIMKKESYVEKMMAILGDKSKFLTLGLFGTWGKRLKGSLLAFRSTSQSTFSTQSLTHSGNGPVDRRRSEIILQKGTNRRWRVTFQRTPIAAGLTVNLTFLSCLVVGQNNIVMSLKLCTFVVLNQFYVGRNHLL